MELALVIPVALLLLAGTIDAGRLFFTRLSIENAAREGAVFAMGDPLCDTSARTTGDDPNTADWHVRNEAGEIDGLTTNFSCSTFVEATGLWATRSIATCDDGDRYEVEVSTDFTFLTPILTPIFGETLELSASATSVVLNDAYDPTATPIPWPSPTPPPPCTVPYLFDLSLGEAETAWTDAGFDANNLDTDPPSMKDDDIVLGQQPADGEELSCEDGEVTVSESA